MGREMSPRKRILCTCEVPLKVSVGSLVAGRGYLLYSYCSCDCPRVWQLNRVLDRQARGSLVLLLVGKKFSNSTARQPRSELELLAWEHEYTEKDHSVLDENATMLIRRQLRHHTHGSPSPPWGEQQLRIHVRNQLPI